MPIARHQTNLPRSRRRYTVQYIEGVEGVSHCGLGVHVDQYVAPGLDGGRSPAEIGVHDIKQVGVFLR